ncbi:GSCFA domain-containing protein [Algoriphagus pacificus]|uniref:GSCFA domain-containing protein n=1 Tax=Algoriphagus pacificus TaxID=2811234 RepID=A0ABS3CLM4_9BACT|nr:GSCFA domain-containing protein [Algoriphagus pacificus]MBN7818001.1 GSCFA domain-containing protein [Algoriphagus pacificus]
MQWTTSFEIPSFPNLVTHEDKILSMGSCFAESMGKRMLDSKFDILINPFGTIFNPISLQKLLKMALESSAFPGDLYLEREDLHFHYLAHSQVMGFSLEELRGKLAGELSLTKDYLENGNLLILTLGTAWIYELAESGEQVANCHKQPGNLFKKRLLSLTEMSDTLASTFSELFEFNPQLNIILTLSPVRHTKDGIPENQLSKSILRVLCADLSSQFDKVSYFPSYEIMVDELRDYRFYKPDLIHPTTQAEDYIWKKWKKSVLSEETYKLAEQIEKIKTELSHRPFNPKSESHQKFLRNLKEKLERLNTQFDFSSELEKVNAELSDF